ncbi:epidermal growth factor receptor substrate 15 homolog [Eurosta solidaginis]|uniref:epidermal growth factor receptor substrate 15 homolog n=1 Tax=Eurosta solidaginis TaxID=178769 RepID=UPI0035311E6F
MLLPDETYDQHDKNPTIAVSDQNTLSKSTNKNKTSKTKVKPTKHQLQQRNDSLSGSAGAISGGSGSGSAADSNNSRIKSTASVSFPYSTSNFFTNILDTLGDILPQCEEFTHQQPAQKEENAAASAESTNLCDSSSSESTAEEWDPSARRLTTNADMLHVICDNFLRRYRIRPDFFCQYQQAFSSATLMQQTTKPKNVKTTNVACHEPVTFAATERCAIKTEDIAVTIKSDETKIKLDKQMEMQQQQEEQEKLFKQQQQKQQRQAELQNLYTLPLIKHKKTCNASTTTTKVADAAAAAAVVGAVQSQAYSLQD